MSTTYKPEGGSRRTKAFNALVFATLVVVAGVSASMAMAEGLPVEEAQLEATERQTSERVPPPFTEADMLPTVDEGLLATVEQEAPAELVRAKRSAEERGLSSRMPMDAALAKNDVSFSRRNDGSQKSEVAPGSASLRPSRYAADVHVEALDDEEEYKRIIEKARSLSEPVSGIDCATCYVGVVDRKPSYVQYLVIDDGKFINLVSEQPETWAMLRPWVERLGKHMN